MNPNPGAAFRAQDGLGRSLAGRGCRASVQAPRCREGFVWVTGLQRLHPQGQPCPDLPKYFVKTDAKAGAALTAILEGIPQPGQMEWGLGHGSPGLGGPGFGRVLAVGDPGREMSCSQAGCQQSPGSAFLPEASGGPGRGEAPQGQFPTRDGCGRARGGFLNWVPVSVCGAWGAVRGVPTRPDPLTGKVLSSHSPGLRGPPAPAQPMLLITRRRSVCSALALISQKWKRHLLSHGFATCNPRPSPQFNTNQPFCFQ